MSTNFFDQQDQARRKTGLLLFYYALAIVAIIGTLYVAAALIFNVVDSGESRPSSRPGVGVVVEGEPVRGGSTGPSLWNPELLGIISIGTLAVVGLATAFKVSQLSGGGHVVAESLGGRLIDPNSRDPVERRLLNVVEEMALASGVPVPPVYLMEKEEGINAFAAGYSPGDAAIGVTRGAVTYLSRDELQGVIAHEFSHILNGDMRINIRLMGILFGIMVLGVIGQIMLRGGYYSNLASSRRDDNKGGQIALFGLVLVILGWVGVLFGRLIQAAISRQREYLADASAVQFTRNPDGIGGALKKLGAISQGARLQSPDAIEASHMFFGDAVGVMLNFNALATHPPIEERIKRIDPQFDGRFPSTVKPAYLAVEESSRSAKPKQRRSPFDPITGPMGAAGQVGGGVMGPAVVMGASRAVADIGAPRQEHYDFAADFLRDAPQPLLDAARDPFSARALVYALLLDDDKQVNRQQMEIIAGQDERGTDRETAWLRSSTTALPEIARLPLVELAMPALRQLSKAQYNRFRTNVEALIKADQQFTLFEYILMRMVVRHLDRHFTRTVRSRVRYRSIAPLTDPIVDLLSSLALLGHDEPSTAREAFDAAAGGLGLTGATMRTASGGILQAVDEALKPLAQASPSIKRQVLEACATSIAHDGRVVVAEAELLRGIADALECPMPPFAADLDVEGV